MDTQHKFSRTEWESAIRAGEGQIKQGMMIMIQGELLIERAKKEVKNMPEEKKTPESMVK